MTNAALEFDHVSKRYRSTVAYRSLRAEIADRSRPGRHRTAIGVTGDADPRTRPAALSDFNLAIQPGESVGLVGPNGAGKSTALRIAARITAPTEGVVRVRGRIGALIEVGAGIHPELTGRENIWLYGAILGMRRPEIARRFDDIVEFAEVGATLDLPIKRWSSGMQLRLGFAIAAVGAPDIFVVDEALAVGDARFQLRCLARMTELTRSGTTLVFVSHDLASVQSVCERTVVLVDGRTLAQGPTHEALAAYLQWVSGSESSRADASAGIFDDAGMPLGETDVGSPIEIRLRLPVRASGPITVALGVRDGHPWNLFGMSTTIAAAHAGEVARCRLAAPPLLPGVYDVWASVDGDDGHWHEVGRFRVRDPNSLPPRSAWLPPIAIEHEWHFTSE